MIVEGIVVVVIAVVVLVTVVNIWLNVY